MSYNPTIDKDTYLGWRGTRTVKLPENGCSWRHKKENHFVVLDLRPALPILFGYVGPRPHGLEAMVVGPI